MWNPIAYFPEEMKNSGERVLLKYTTPRSLLTTVMPGFSETFVTIGCWQSGVSKYHDGIGVEAGFWSENLMGSHPLIRFMGAVMVNKFVMPEHALYPASLWWPDHRYTARQPQMWMELPEA